MPDAVIVLPGLMGSELKKGDAVVWPGAPWELLTPYLKMAELLDPNLEVGDVVRSAIRPVYAPLIEALARCGFLEAGAKPTLKVCPYDWRGDNAESAKRLADCVTHLHTLHGDELRIDILAHSMGGLVARYFLESGDFTRCPGFSCVRNLVTMGTPHRGAPMALAAALGGMRKLFLNAEQVQQLVSRPEFPSVYQLLPPGDEPFLWDLAPAARLKPIDLYQPETAGRLGLVEVNLQSAVRFRAGLSEHRRPPSVSYFCFVGASFSTAGHARADYSVERPVPQLIAVDRSGDDTVPYWSASLPGAQKLAVGGAHGSLFHNYDLLTVLGQLLGKPGYLAAQDADLFSISVSPEVTAADTALEVAMRRAVPIASLEGELVVVKLTDATGNALADRPVVGRYKVEYAGAPLDSLTVQVTAPKYAGAYAVELRHQGALLVDRAADFLVQRVV